MDLYDVLVALANACANVVDVAGRKMHTYEYVPSRIIAPAWIVEQKDSIDPHMTHGNRFRVKFVGTVVVPWVDPREAQMNLAKLRSQTGASSIFAALEAAKGLSGQLALSGAADDLNVESIGEPGKQTIGDTDYLGAEFTIEVIGS